MEQLFKDQIKLKIFDEDPTVTRMTALQNYSQNLRNKGHISTAEFGQRYIKHLPTSRNLDQI